MGSQMINPNSLNVALPQNQQLPSEGPKAIPILLDFTGAIATYTLDLLLLTERGFLSMVQCLYIDNSGSSNPVVVTVNGTNQNITAKANTQGYYAVLAPNPCKLTFAGTANTVLVPVFLLNMPVSGSVWSTT